MPLWFIFIFPVLMLLHWKDKKAVLYSVAGILISLIYFILLFKIFIPANETPGVEYVLFNYSALGSGPGKAISYIVQHPFDSVRMFFVNHLDNPEYDKVKLEFYIVYFVSGGFVLLFRPKYLIWFIPIVAQKVLNDDPFRWGLATYYSAEVVILLPLSVFLALASFKSTKLQKYLVVALCILTTGMTIYKMDSSNHEIPWTFYKSKIKFYHKSFYETTFDIRKVNRLLKQIPKDAKVSASNVFTPHLAQRQFIYFFPTVNDAEYIIFSVFDNNYLMSGQENDKHRNTYLNSTDWEIIGKEYPVFLLKKNTGETNQIQTKKNNSSDTLTCNFEITERNKNHILFSNGAKADTISHLNHNFFRSDSSSLCLTPADQYSHGISLKDIKNIDRIEISVWYLSPDSNVFIVMDNKENLYQKSGETEIRDNKGWKKIELTCSLKENQKLSSTIIYLWNAGNTPVYFDDLLIVTRQF
jgi:hypothetical protein